MVKWADENLEGLEALEIDWSNCFFTSIRLRITFVPVILAIRGRKTVLCLGEYRLCDIFRMLMDFGCSPKDHLHVYPPFTHEVIAEARARAAILYEQATLENLHYDPPIFLEIGDQESISKETPSTHQQWEL